MPYSKADIIKDSLEDIGELEAQESVSAEDSAYVGKKYDQLHAYLAEQQIAYWASGAVPDAVAAHVVMMLSGYICRRYLTSQAEIREIKRDAEEAEKKIRDITANEQSRYPTPQTFF